MPVRFGRWFGKQGYIIFGRPAYVEFAKMQFKNFLLIFVAKIGHHAFYRVVSQIVDGRASPFNSASEVLVALSKWPMEARKVLTVNLMLSDAGSSKYLTTILSDL